MDIHVHNYNVYGTIVILINKWYDTSVCVKKHLFLKTILILLDNCMRRFIIQLHHHVCIYPLLDDCHKLWASNIILILKRSSREAYMYSFSCSLESLAGDILGYLVFSDPWVQHTIRESWGRPRNYLVFSVPWGSSTIWESWGCPGNPGILSIQGSMGPAHYQGIQGMSREIHGFSTIRESRGCPGKSMGSALSGNPGDVPGIPGNL